jgi:hypothetical protein
MSKEFEPSQTELERLAHGLAQTLIQRRDLYPRQLDGGRYVCISRPLTTGHILAHLRGTLTLGASVLDEQSRARYLVFDADAETGLRQLIQMAATLQTEGVPSYLESSRRGLHLWLFFSQSLSAVETRGFGLGLGLRFDLQGIEMFPKQDRIQEGPGSLIRLPFGIHRKTGRRYGFMTPDLQALAPTLSAQIRLLSTPQTVPQAAIEYYRSLWPNQKEPPPVIITATNEPSGAALSARIKSSISTYDFISRFVELTSAGRGLCPFHEDRVHSFAVNQEKNYWHCFAGCGGGSIIDFWMKRQGCDFPTAVRELAKLLL